MNHGSAESSWCEEADFRGMIFRMTDILPPKPTPVQLLLELEEVMRLMPAVEKLHWTDSLTIAWVGRASAVMEAWASLFVQSAAIVEWRIAVNVLQSRAVSDNDPNYVILRLVHQAQSQLRLHTVGPVNSAVGTGQVFDYFDQIRKIIEEATADILFVDPYMNADFVSRYLPSVKNGVTVRLLTSSSGSSAKYLAGLRAAAESFSKQYGLAIEIRVGGELHDRWIFVDRQKCFQSGASFKDGATKAGTTITQNVDAFSNLNSLYEGLWQSAN